VAFLETPEVFRREMERRTGEAPGEVAVLLELLAEEH
jgi:hypothetical protein